VRDSKVPPEELYSTVRSVANNFISDGRASDVRPPRLCFGPSQPCAPRCRLLALDVRECRLAWKVIAIGLNTVREICTRVPLAMDEELLHVRHCCDRPRAAALPGSAARWGLRAGLSAVQEPP
jgi:hypothetical protein